MTRRLRPDRTRLSDVCSVEQITASLARTGNLHKKAKAQTPRQNFMAMLEAITAPPTLPSRSDFQFEANQPEGVEVAKAAA